MLVLLIMDFASPSLKLSLLGKWLVLQGCCVFLAMLTVNICLYFVRLNAQSS